MPMMALSLASVLSAAAMSGRRSSNCEGTPMGIGGGGGQQRFDRQREIGRQFAEENRDGVFVLRPRNADVDGRGLRALQCGPGLHHGDVVVRRPVS